MQLDSYRTPFYSLLVLLTIIFDIGLFSLLTACKSISTFCEAQDSDFDQI